MSVDFRCGDEGSRKTSIEFGTYQGSDVFAHRSIREDVPGSEWAKDSMFRRGEDMRPSYLSKSREEMLGG